MNSLSKWLVLTIAMLLAQGPTLGAQISSGKAEIHWSERADILSPDRNWLLKVSPQGEDGPAVVSIQRATGRKRYVLFRLQRDASFLWSSDSTSLIIEDRPFSDHSRLILFQAPFLSKSEQGVLTVDRIVKAAAKRSLSPGENINYYLPEVVGWKEGHWLVTAGVTTVRGDSGPFTSHCSGYLVVKNGSTIARTFSESELKDKFGVTCQ